MKKILYSMFISILIVGCSSGNNISNAPPAATISSVTVGKMTGDTASSEFSTLINFKANTTMANWQFGFYMPRSFLVSGANNPNLVMQICKGSSSQCVDLAYQVATSISNNDLSAGYTTVLAPSSAFTLTTGESYTVQLLHSNQWNAGNYSAVPQNFFFIANNQVSNITPQQSVYSLLDYNQASVEAGVNTHLQSNWSNSQTQLPAFNGIIPSPVNYQAATGSFTIDNNLTIHNLVTDTAVAAALVADLKHDLKNISVKVDNVASSTGIIIQAISDPSLINNDPEGYQIQIQDNAIIISVINDNHNAGAFYALQTLRQLWNQSATIAAATITDYPRFKYRGVLLDSARHFFSVSEVKNLIDLMATHKLNTLHMHFADDEGFRLAMTAYPTLSTLGDSRKYSSSMIGLMFIQGNLDPSNYGNIIYPYVNTLYQGTYSSAAIKELIAYANTNQITIIPEIDLPGHARALIKALPSDFVDSNDLSKFVSVQGYTDDVIPVCTYNTDISVGSQFTTTINSIIKEAASQFTNQSTLYAINSEVSVGGDEVSANAWTNDSSCQGAWTSLSALEKSHKFFQMLAASNSGIKFSGWQQFVQNDDTSLGTNIVPASQTGHVWVWSQSTTDASPNIGINQAISLAVNNYPVVLNFSDQVYFDLAYTPEITEPGFTWAAPYLDTQSALTSAISSESVVSGTNLAQQGNIAGIEGTLWSENLATYNHMIYMGLPKMAGLSEAAWSPAATTVENNQVNWQSLATRLGCGSSGFLNYLNKLYGVLYRGYPDGISLEVPPGTLCTN